MMLRMLKIAMSRAVVLLLTRALGRIPCDEFFFLQKITEFNRGVG